MVIKGKIKSGDIIIPCDVPRYSKSQYIKNYLILTHDTGRLMLFAGDQKIEHLNDDFYGIDISKDDADPKHLFEIASKAKIGAFATQLGLIAKYGLDYPEIPYIVKLNSKTNLIKTFQKDPISRQLWDVESVLEVKKNSRVNILGVGYTIYPGSEFESIMMSEAAHIVYQAHKNGLIAVLWIYPRGKSVIKEKDAHLIAGAAGIGACLGADFVKVNYPDSVNPSKDLKEAVLAGGRTKVICAGGPSIDVSMFLQRLYDQIYVSGVGGSATGRNIHQKSLPDAIKMANSIFAITIEGKTVQEALEIYHG